MAKITKRSDDYSKWYTDLIIQAKLADYSPVKGCMIIRPNGYAIWEQIQTQLDALFKQTGHENAYFPLFIPESFMHKEAEHVEGFAPEAAVVTHGGGSELEEKLYVRPTSETMIWHMYAKWIQSYRDLPLLYNQWANVVRWEMRTRLFLRTTEFLWQEGHTAHATADEAEDETRKIIELYRHFVEDYMAMPVIVGKKSPSETFAGALHSYSIEAMMQDGKALQAGTSHNLGQNFAKAFDVKFQDEDGELQYAWATSWGVSTRLIGALIMTHSDDKGLVLPPKMAATQLLAIPIYKSVAGQREEVLGYINEILAELPAGVSWRLDDRDNVSPGWKFSDAELQGIPLRLEAGPRDLEKGVVVLVRRDTGEKEVIAKAQVADRVVELLAIIQQEMFDRALAFRCERTQGFSDYSAFANFLNHDSGFAEAYWCGGEECENKVKEETKATIRNIPFSKHDEEGLCVVCGQKEGPMVIWSRAY
jgi:prolyl-tRNA synthetase